MFIMFTEIIEGVETMAKGILYVMTTVVPGLIKIGKTGTGNFESRMSILEHNGYSNVVGLKRKFAIEVEDYDEKEKLLDNIFSKSRVPNTELFALDVGLVIQLLSSFEGRQVYPKEISKEESFDRATTEIENNNILFIPNGEYYLKRKLKGFGIVEGKMRVKDGKITLLAGSTIAPSDKKVAELPRKDLKIGSNHLLKQDVICSSPSTAALICIGKNTNGWDTWRNSEGKKIDIYRTSNN